MQTTRYWQVLLEAKIPDVYEYLIDADKNRTINYFNSGTNFRKFIEAIVALMMKFEGIIEDEKEIKNIGLANGIAKLKSKQAIDKKLRNNLDTIRKFGNEGSHPFENIEKEEVDKIFDLVKELAEHFACNYLDKILQEKNRSKIKEITELPELQENEIYIYECLKPECKRKIKERESLNICKKCGGPVKFKAIDANYIKDVTKPVEPYKVISTLGPSRNNSSTTTPQNTSTTNESTNKIKKYKLEIYDSSLELIKEVRLNKDNILVGRSSTKGITIPEIDLVDIANDENGNCLISREHVYINKIGDDYYVKNASSKALVQLNHQRLEQNQNNVKLNDNDVIILSNFIALVYRVA